jgi:hypothetical protein
MHDELCEMLSYDPETGVFTWLVRPSNCIHVGDVAGHLNKIGYRAIRIAGHYYLAHRLAWFYMTGEWPLGWMDHSDMVRDNNRWINLREATPSQNRANCGVNSASLTGLKGVTWKARRNKYEARIMINGKRFSLGFFDTAELAHEAYMRKAINLYGEFARSASALEFRYPK